MFFYISSAINPLNFIFWKSEYYSHILQIFFWKTYKDFYLIALVVELFTCFLYYIYFPLISEENQQYLNFRKSVQKLQTGFCKHAFGKHIEPKTIIFCLQL